MHPFIHERKGFFVVSFLTWSQPQHCELQVIFRTKSGEVFTTAQAFWKSTESELEAPQRLDELCIRRAFCTHGLPGNVPVKHAILPVQCWLISH